jgi:hypothetical protein
MDTQDILD